MPYKDPEKKRLHNRKYYKKNSEKVKGRIYSKRTEQGLNSSAPQKSSDPMEELRKKIKIIEGGSRLGKSEIVPPINGFAGKATPYDFEDVTLDYTDA